MTLRGFGSDNHAGVLPEVLESLVKANVGHAPSYGTDALTMQARALLAEEFGSDTKSYFVFNGTAANVLCVRAVTQSFESILCAQTSHLNTDECGAPEWVGGRKLIPIVAHDGKLSVDDLAPWYVRGGDQHFAQPKVLSITQPTELGTLYTRQELQELCEWAHSRRMFVHMDGARLVNAAAALDCSLAALTADVGVDVLSFGGTKNGLLFGEAVVFLRPELAENFQYYHKQCMQLPSKTRFIAAQFFAWLENENWRHHASHANRMAAILAHATKAHESFRITRPVQTNAVFACVPRAYVKPLREAAFFYVWDENTFEVRLMTSFDTQQEDIDRFADRLAELEQNV